MKVKNENFTPRERINREMLDRMLADEARRDACETNPSSPIPTYPCAAAPHSCPSCPQRSVQQTRTKPECAADRRRNVSDTSGTGICRTPVYPGVSLAMVYSPCQAFEDLYEVDIALLHGTIFKELDKPFYPTPCSEGWCNR